MPKARKQKKQRTRAQRIRRRITIGGVVALCLGIVAVVLLTVYVGNRALIAKDQLQAAQGRLTTFKSALGQPNAPSTAKLYEQLQANTAKAAQQVDDPVWSFYEQIPVVGPNLKAFRQTADLVNALVHDGVGPLAKAADGISVESLKPKNGGIDIQPLKQLTPAIGDIDDAITAADRSAKAIDTKDVVPQLKGPIAQVQSLLEQAAPATHELRKVMPVLYPALGGEGARHYLLIFQNNAEERASGGNPASMAMLVVNDGKIKLGRQGNSGDFPHPYTVPPYTPSGKGNGDWSKIYTNYASTYVTNITMTPDYPTNAKLARAMWRNVYGGKVDGVISFDPVALSYLMKATGPVKLADGTVIDSNNAVPFLLNQVYAKYTDPRVQDAVFASAAQAIFTAVTNGQGSPQAYLDQLKPMMDEQRLKMWSTRADEEKLLLDSQLGNMLPKDNSDATVLGVYNNDDATSKMSYYMDEQVKVTTNTCTPTPKYTMSAKVINTLPLNQIYSLPEYVKAHQKRIPIGGDRQWVQVYGPVGSKLSAVYIDGEKVTWGTNLLPELNTNYAATGAYNKRPAVKGNMYDRPVGVVNITIPAADSVTVKAVFTGGTDNSKTVSVSHTPKVRPVPVTYDTAKCG
ncbi:DUF4012 domain-containing protein [Amnibacterium kyonggiense]|uniref:Uncharacterized protein DUF4012 n=1 Tax=Amnibacterium kyonggiense TaxID=595671 RepID=A0A4R7FHU8_9MICO|nr:DUF4012 domain-containing protein [Amnibacterium kyonggiense]TDS74947.1 uncharacterized protein DUF4012 [Amnibacterium kyonggiense]